MDNIKADLETIWCKNNPSCDWSKQWRTFKRYCQRCSLECWWTCSSGEGTHPRVEINCSSIDWIGEEVNNCEEEVEGLMEHWEDKLRMTVSKRWLDSLIDELEWIDRFKASMKLFWLQSVWMRSNEENEPTERWVDWLKRNKRHWDCKKECSMSVSEIESSRLLWDEVKVEVEVDNDWRGALEDFSIVKNLWEIGRQYKQLTATFKHLQTQAQWEREQQN